AAAPANTEMALGRAPPPGTAFELVIAPSCIVRQALYCLLGGPGVEGSSGVMLCGSTVRARGTLRKVGRGCRLSILPPHDFVTILDGLWKTCRGWIKRVSARHSGSGSGK